MFLYQICAGLSSPPKNIFWSFLQGRGLLNSVIDIYGQLELLRMLDQFFDRALCFATEGYVQQVEKHQKSTSPESANGVCSKYEVDLHPKSMCNLLHW